MICGICEAPSHAWRSGVILNKYPVTYFACSGCGFVQTEPPHWFGEAYSEAITRTDLGLVSRNIRLSRVALAVIGTIFDRSGRFVDYGGGYGLLVRLLRDYGLDCYRSDRYAPNLFAAGFEAAEPAAERYELLTAFEVFEHLADPVAEMERMLKYSRSIFLTTQLLPKHRPGPNEWWYYGLEHGQHVSIYTRRSLEVLAERFGLTLYTTPQATFHLLTDRKLAPWRFSLATQPRLARLLVPFLRRPSLLPSDVRRVIEDLSLARTGNPP